MQINDSDRKKRITRAVQAGTALICAGLFYGYCMIPRGFWIPCLFRTFTGYKCPGCGISHMAAALLNGKWEEAVACNWGLFLISPFIIHLCIETIRSYVTERPPEKVMEKETIACCIFLVVWGIMRNLLGL